MTSYQDTISFLEQNLKFRCRIPLRNRKKEIVEYAIVDAEDYPEVINQSWRLQKRKESHNMYAQGNTRRLHTFLLGKHPDPKYVIDHLNGNGLDNRKSNLKYRTYSENAQNRKPKSNTASKYIGVFKEPAAWRARINGLHLGQFQTEEEAAMQYDKAALIIYGPDAQTNKLVQHDEVKDLTIDDISKSRKKLELPSNIIRKNNRYYAIVMYDRKKYKSPPFCKIEEAVISRNQILEDINKLKETKLQQHYAQPILRNNEGIAIIPVTSKSETVYSLVDDDIWHELMTYSWSLSHNYANARINGKSKLMHHYILGVDKFSLDGKVVDHISRNELDNRREYLRIVTLSQNSQNRRSDKPHMSVYKSKVKSEQWTICTRFNNKKLRITTFTSEVSASIGYNIFAIVNDYYKMNPITESEYSDLRQKLFDIIVKGRELLTGNEFNRIYDQLISGHSVET